MYTTSSFVCIISNSLVNSNWGYSPKSSIGVKIGDFLSGVIFKFDGSPWKTIVHLFCTTLSYVHHFNAIGEFKLELQSGNAKFRSKSVIFLSRMTLKFDGWLWKITGHLFYTTSSFVHHFKAIGEFKLELQSGHAQFGSKYIMLSYIQEYNME